MTGRRTISAWPYIPELQALWNLNKSIYTWPGVVIASGGADRVANLILPRQGLTGVVPAALGRLTAMTYLDLSNNSLTSVPAELVDLDALKFFDLSGNPLTSAVRIRCSPTIVYDVILWCVRLDNRVDPVIFDDLSPCCYYCVLLTTRTP